MRYECKTGINTDKGYDPELPVGSSMSARWWVRRSEEEADFARWQAEIDLDVSGDPDDGPDDSDPDERDYEWVEAITVVVGSIWLFTVIAAVMLYVRAAP